MRKQVVVVLEWKDSVTVALDFLYLMPILRGLSPSPLHPLPHLAFQQLRLFSVTRICLSSCGARGEHHR